jgi:hypothetical protein
LTVTINAASKVYGSANPAFSVTYTGFVLDETSAVLGGTLTFSTSATDNSPVGSYTVTPGGLTSGNYTINFASGKLAVTPAALTVTTDAASKVYGAAMPDFTVSYAGFVLGETSAVLGGTLGFSTTATAASTVGTYTVTPGGLTSSNYTITFVDGTLTITKAPLSVKADDKARTYGEANPVFTGTLLGVVNGDNITASYTTIATPSSAAGTYPITPVLADPGNRLDNYNVTSTNGTLTIGSAVLKVVANDYSRLYGAANPTLDGVLTGVQSGDNITVIYTTTATASSGVGSYDIVPELSDPDHKLANYAVTIVKGKLTIQPAPLTVTINAASKVYGSANPAFSVTYTGFVLDETSAVLGGTLTFSTSATDNSSAGSYKVTPGGLTSSNYTITFVDANLTVTPAALTVTTDNVSKVYGAALPAFMVSYNGFVLGETYTVLGGTLSFNTTATASSVVGSYKVTPGGLTSSNYTITFVDGTLSITKAPLSVKADDKARGYGEANPALTGTLTGVVNSDNITAGYSTTATATSPVGTYPITPALSDPEGKLTNYDLTSTNGTLTVGKAALSVKADNASKLYGANLPTFTGTLSGVQSGDNITASYTTGATASSPVGSYSITPVLADPDGKLINYAVTINNGTLSITPAALTVTAEDKSKTYGAANPTFTASYNGLVLNETPAVLGGTLGFNTAATTSSIVGTYSITPSGLTSNNYTITFVDGKLNVTKAPLSIKADDKSKMFSAPLPTFTASYTGFVLNETAGVLSGTLSCTTTADALSPVGTYPISCSGVSSGNYAISFVDGVLTVTAYVDNTAPTTTAKVAPAPNGAGWNNSNVTVTLTATDEQYGSGVKSITFSASGAQSIASTTVNGSSATVPVISAEGTTTISFFAKDNVGNTETAKTIVVKLDKTGPVNVTGTADRAPDNTNGWYNHPVTINFSGTDALSGIASCASVIYSGPTGANLTVNGSCTDKAGNVTSASFKGLKYDSVAPVTTAKITQGQPPATTNGWYPYAVNVELQATDDGSGVKELTYSALGAGGFSTKTSKNGYASFPVTKDGITIINYQTRDNAGNLEAVKTLMVKIDTTAPTVTPSVSPAPNAAGWNNSDVTVTLNASDAGAGVKSIAYRINSGAVQTVSGSTATIPVTSEGTTYISYWAIDLAGNGNEGYSKTLTVKLDKTMPTVKSSNDGTTYKRNQNVNANYSCSDTQGSGIASCVGSIASNAKLDTSTTGRKTYTVTATDKAGNVYVRTITYNVA